MKQMKLYLFSIILIIELFIIPPAIAGGNNECRITSNNDGIYTLLLGNLSISVSAKVGGRIVSFKRNNKEILTTSETHPTYFGGTLWLSPQNDYWPQYSSIDRLPYEAIIFKNKLRLTSSEDSISGIRVVKEFFISPKDTSVILNYFIENTSNKVKFLAPWDVTRVFGGLSFFPKGNTDLPIKSDLKNTQIEDGIIWFKYNSDSLVSKQKLYSTNKAGWIAHYYKDLLFIKCFPHIKTNQIPPQQGETEIFSAPHGLYIELENHGKYTKLLPGKTIRYSQKWILLQSNNFKTESKNQLLQTVNKKVE